MIERDGKPQAIASNGEPYVCFIFQCDERISDEDLRKVFDAAVSEFAANHQATVIEWRIRPDIWLDDFKLVKTIRGRFAAIDERENKLFSLGLKSTLDLNEENFEAVVVEMQRTADAQEESI